MPAMRAFDPTRRGYYTTGSAVAYAQKPDFGVYVMGHSHMPYLSKVRVRVINKHA
jgi:predicted phosphodiesterase